MGNLLNNAAKYSDPGGHVRLSGELTPLGLTLRVKDDGIGISAEQLPHIFDMFTQVDTSLERSQGGLGLGLTLVKSLVEIHGGTISAHSDGAGKGSEFVIHLPDVDAAAQPMPPLPSLPAKAWKRHRFVVAEDNRDAAESHRERVILAAGLLASVLQNSDSRSREFALLCRNARQHLGGSAGTSTGEGRAGPPDERLRTVRPG